MPLTPAQLRSLLRASVRTMAGEIACDACYDALDRFAEAHLAGLDAADALPRVAEHLAVCHECRDEFEALLDGLRAIGAEAVDAAA